MKNKISEFWKWFEKNNHAYLFLDDVDQEEKERLLENLVDELHKYCDNIWPLIGGMPEEGKELIITAEGDMDYFKQVEDLISQAPDIDKWTFIDFIPATVGDPFKIDYEGVELDTEKMWFLPLEEETDPTSIGLRICTPNYELVKDHEFFMSAIYKVLETLIGEKTFALDVDYVEAGEVPENPEEEGMMELLEIYDYVEWEKKNRHIE